MARLKITFPNRQGIRLAGLLETPDENTTVYALFAHCFTCSKDIAAASRISRALNARGIAVLRFDFTGLGNSDGDFANTGFSSNIQDLIAAAEFLGSQYRAPALLIGHSLGGAAVLAAAGDIAAARAVVTIGAPATADHILRLFTTHPESTLDPQQAEISLGGRVFTISRRFLEDIAAYDSTGHIAELGKALLILHSPVDEVVSIDEAAKIYGAARHPKSFISLDRADHLLSSKEDSRYAADVIAAWAGRYLDLTTADPGREADSSPRPEPGQVLVGEQNKQFTRRIFTANHLLTADEPAPSGGLDLGPNPYEYLLAALGACTSMTIRMYANRKQFPLENIEVLLQHSRIHADDCRECESTEGMVDRIEKNVKLEGDLTAEQRDRLMEIADRCPVHRTLLNEILIQSTLV